MDRYEVRSKLLKLFKKYGMGGWSYDMGPKSIYGVNESVRIDVQHTYGDNFLVDVWKILPSFDREFSEEVLLGSFEELEKFILRKKEEFEK